MSTTISNEPRRAFRFFLEHGSAVGRIDANGRVAFERARCALELARAEQLLDEAVDLGVASLEWLDDCESYDPGDVVAEEEAREKFESNEWTGPFGCVVTCGDNVASLWGIVVGSRGTDDPYCRVVAAELADEISDALRQAIGDARDADPELRCVAWYAAGCPPEGYEHAARV